MYDLLVATTLLFQTHATDMQSFEPFPHREVSFGLTEAERQALFDAAGGQADLRHFVAVTVPESFDVRAKELPGFASVRLPPVPPTYGAPLPPAAAPGNALPPVDFFASVTADPALAGAWWIKALNVPAAWELATGKGVTIADCDSGFYVGEADLKANLRVDLRRDFADLAHPTAVADGGFIFHGTAVAAIMTAALDGAGTNGVAYDAKLVPLQNFNYDPAKDQLDKEEATARCVLFALRIPEVSVIVVENQTLSGSTETDAGTREAIKLAVASGVPVVVPAGNASLELTTEAKDDTGSIVVGALRQDGRAAVFSNYGARVDVSAFGEGLETLYGPGGYMDAFGGTTGAAAQVGATVALMREVNPELTPREIRSLVVATRRQVPGSSGVGGQLDVFAAVNAARAAAGDRAAHAAQERVRARALDILGPVR